MSDKILKIVNQSPIRFIFCGYFRSPSEEWVHISRSLGEYELMIVREGTLYIADEDKKYEVSEGEYVIIPPTAHQYGYQSSYCEFYWLHFECGSRSVEQNVVHGSEQCVVNNLNHGSNQSEVQNLDMDSEQSEVQNEEQEILTMPLYGKLVNRNRVYQLAEQTAEIERAYHDKIQAGYSLMSLLYEIQKQTEISYKNKGNQPDVICRSVKEYIDGNQMSKLSVREIAEYAGYHEKYLSYLFHKETGKVLKTYIVESKMKCACDLLLGTNETIAQIGYHLGYSDAQNFATAFRKRIGVTPGEFRRIKRTDS